MSLEEMEKIWHMLVSNPKVGIGIMLLLMFTAVIAWYLTAYIGEKGRSAATREHSEARPYLDIEADKIEFQDWTEQEKNEHPTWPDRYQKVVLWFHIHNSTDVPAANVSVTATSDLLVHRNIGRFSPEGQGGTFSDRHVITRATSGRQPFTVALDKKAVPYFKQGIVEIKLDVRVQYSGFANSAEYSIRRVYVYSPTLPNEARETFSEAN